ncbi:TNF receptor-associated factor 2-like isoform X2 [Acropora millepora]|nr:TNF receptor-associated factor 2-like isoform X2 [Acropora millepora]XP_044174893.1 TNF receptor-associated factor 2-like isoform X2 [Acropora millepora]XP_044174894.1 TNF receptor-associated factor 2-like isoform X2 [Acropora millepora]
MQDNNKEEVKVPKSGHNSVRSKGPLPTVNEDHQPSAHEQASQSALPSTLAGSYPQQQREISELRGIISRLEQRINDQQKSHDKHVITLEVHIQQQKLENGQLKDRVDYMVDTIKCLEQRLGEQQKSYDKQVNKLEARHAQQEKESGILKGNISAIIGTIQHVVHRLTNVEFKIAGVRGWLASLWENHQEQYLSNGCYIWKIENYQQRRQDAINGVKTHVFSPTICTSRYGYKLRLRISLNGMGSGVGRYIALFVQMVKGNNDVLLDWPFTGKITLSILDQSEGLAFRQHISKTVIATRNLLAFQKPIAGYNSACEGYEEMAPIKDILDPQYIKNNTMLVCVHIEP